MIPDNVIEHEGLWLLKADTVATPAFLAGGPFSPHWYTDLPEITGLDEHSVCLDVGAYIGDSALPMLDQGATVYAYEPQPDAAICFAHNCPRALLRPVAVGDGREMVRSGGLGGNMGARWTQHGLAGGIPVEAITIDAEGFSHVDLIKIDAEGMEPAVLRGARETIRRSKPDIIIEINPGGLARYGWAEEDITGQLLSYEGRIVHRCETHRDWVFTPRRP